MEDTHAVGQEVSIRGATDGRPGTSISESAPTQGNPARNRDGITETISLSNESLISTSLTPTTSLHEVAVPTKNLPNSSIIDAQTINHVQNSALKYGDVEMAPVYNGRNRSEHDFDDKLALADSSLLKPNTTVAPSYAVRDIVLPLLMRNSDLRDGVGKDHASENVLGVAQNFLTDEVCQSIAVQMLEVQKQLHGGGASTSNSGSICDAHRTFSITQIGPLQQSNVPALAVNSVASRLNGMARSSSDVFKNDEDSGWSPLKRRRIDTDSPSEQVPDLLQQRRTLQDELSLQTHAHSNHEADSPNGITLSLKSLKNHYLKDVSLKYRPQSDSESFDGNLHIREPNRSHSLTYENDHSLSHSHNQGQVPIQEDKSPSIHFQSRSQFRSHSPIPTFTNPFPPNTPTMPSKHVPVLHPTLPPFVNGERYRSTSQPLSSTKTHATYRSTSVAIYPSKLNDGQSMEISLMSSPLPQPDGSMDLASSHVLDIDMVDHTVKKLPCHQVPSIWGSGVGLLNPGILELTFDIDDETAKKWNIGIDIGSSIHQQPNQNPDSILAIHLLCIPLELAASALQTFHANPKDPNSLWSPHAWPSQGSLVIEINKEASGRQIWLPQRLGSKNTPLNITNAVQIGKNKIRCIQLSPLWHLFVVHADVAIGQNSVHNTVSDHQKQTFNINVDVGIQVDHG